jgi:hypothetical protein
VISDGVAGDHRPYADLTRKLETIQAILVRARSTGVHVRISDYLRKDYLLKVILLHSSTLRDKSFVLAGVAETL